MQNVSCCVQGPGETSETWTYPSMVLVPLCTAMVWRGRCKEKVPPGNLPLPFSTTRLLGAKAKALIPTGSL